MDTKINTSEIDFESFLAIFFKLSSGLNRTYEFRFVSVIEELERRLQDLDTKDDYKTIIRNLLITKLKFWSEILSDLPSIFIEPNGKMLLINSMIYNLQNLTKNAEEVLAKPWLNITNEIAEIAPHPTKQVLKINSSKREKIEMPFRVLLIKKLLDNYIYKRFHNKNDQISTQEILFFTEFEHFIEYSLFFEQTLDKYILNQINGSNDVAEFPISVYLDSTDPEQIENYYSSVLDFLKTINCEVLFEYPPVLGSWWQRVISTSKEIITSDEFVDRLKKIEHGIEINTINKVQSEIDKNQAEALAAILTASNNIPNIATLIGSLLMVKTTNENGEATVYSRTLTTNELIYLKENPHLLHQPSHILLELGKYNGLPSTQNLTE